MKSGGKILIGVGVFALFVLLLSNRKRNKNKNNEDTSSCDGLKGNECMDDMCKHLNSEHVAAEKEIKNILKNNNDNDCAKKLMSVWQKEIKHHFGEEENVVFPAVLKKDKSFEPIINELLQEHKYFYGIINDMKEKKCIGCGKLPKDFCSKLLKHIEKEEDLFKKLKK